MSDYALRSRINLVETLDRVLNKGVVITGDITISVADIDLIYVQLRILLASIETALDLKRDMKQEVRVTDHD